MGMGFDLASMLQDVSNLDTSREQIEYIDIANIDEDPNNFYQLSKVDELASNIELLGLQQPTASRSTPINWWYTTGRKRSCCRRWPRSHWKWYAATPGRQR